MSRPPKDRYVALIRAINVGGYKMPMAELREVCGALGWSDVATYIQSGNVVFSASGKEADLEEALEKAIETRFGYSRPVIVRSAAHWAKYAEGSPFPEHEAERFNTLLLGVAKKPVPAEAAATIEARGKNGEQVIHKGDALWFFFPDGSGTSKVTPAIIDKAAGSPVTTRNWRTVLKIQEMLGAD